MQAREGDAQDSVGRGVQKDNAGPLTGGCAGRQQGFHSRCKLILIQSGMIH